MAILLKTLCAVIMVTAVLAKPLRMTEGGSDSDSTESDSSEEAGNHAEPSEDPQQEETTATDLPNTEAQHTSEVLPTANVEPSVATPDASAQPATDAGQLPVDPLHLLPEDPSQTATGTDGGQETKQDSGNTGATEVQPHSEGTLQPETATSTGTGGDNTQPQVSSTTTTADAFQETTPPSPPDNTATLSPLSTSGKSALPIPISAAVNGVPVCFTFQFPTQEQRIARGDSM